MIKNKLYFVVRKNKEDNWEYDLDSQLRPRMYRDINLLKKYMYKFYHHFGEYAIVEYELKGKPISFDNIDELQ